MSKLKAKISAVAAAVMLAMGGTITLGTMTATPALAANCTYTGPIHNGSDYLDDYGGGQGTYVHTYQSTGSKNRTWCLESLELVNNDGVPIGVAFYIHPLNNLNLCLDAHQNTANYPVWVWGCNHTDPQLWCWNGNGYITRIDDGSLALRDVGRYNIVELGQGNANKWSTNGASLPGC